MRELDDFLKGVEEYKKLGVNPLSLATGCAVKVDLVDVVYPAISSVRDRLREIGVEIWPREDADVFVTRKLSVKRLIDGGSFRAQRAVSLVQVNQRTASDPKLFGDFLYHVYSSVRAGGKLVVGKGHSIVTAKPQGEVAILDMMRLEGSPEKSYTLANNDTIQIIDPAEPPDSKLHTKVALSNSLNDLFVKGVWQNIRVIPVVDSPSPELRQRIETNFQEFSGEIGAELIPEVQPEKGTFMVGATVIGETDHEPPSFYGEVREGMQVLVTRPMGELTPINLYMWVMINPEMLEDMEKAGIDLSRLKRAKAEALRLMAKPNLDVAKVLYDHLPEFGKSFDPSVHVAMTTDVSGPGLMVVKEFAERAGVNVEIHEVPVIDHEICKFATENFVIPNSTASTNGATVIFAEKRVIDDVAQELRRLGHSPQVIGEVKGRGASKVRVSRKVYELIHRTSILNQFEVVG